MEQQGGICWGNSVPDSAEHRAWLIGHFKPEGSPLFDAEIEVKVDFVKAGARRVPEEAKANQTKRTLQLLFSGKVRTSFPATGGRPEHHVTLEQPGDYAKWEPGIVYYWEILADSVIVTICWPANPTAEE